MFKRINASKKKQIRLLVEITEWNSNHQFLRKAKKITKSGPILPRFR